MGQLNSQGNGPRQRFRAGRGPNHTSLTRKEVGYGMSPSTTKHTSKEKVVKDKAAYVGPTEVGRLSLLKTENVTSSTHGGAR